ncbi:MAG: regulatory protein RecX [Clostridia bacterium]|nr:regulatory protein RecX [Clostridia bacterium]
MTEYMDKPSVAISIASVRAQNDGAEMAVTVVIENGAARDVRKFVILTEQYCSLKPTKGPITEEQFEALESASRLCGALRSGQSALSYGSASVLHLTRKIMRHGYTKEEATAAAERLRDVGLINEDDDLSREVEKCLRKLWGSRRIRSHLWSKGFARETLEALPSLLAEVDFPANCASLIRKQYGSVPADPQARRKLCAALARYGYSPEEIREGMRRAIKE